MVCLSGLATIWLVVIFGWREVMSEEDLSTALHKPGLNTDPGQPESQEG